MITKAIVEEIISPYQVRIRIPLLDRISTSALSTKLENLNIATICTLPNCYVNLQVGDIVFVGFEDNTAYKAVILGHLCKSSETNAYADLILNSLSVKTQATLPQNTCIGNITPTQLQCLDGVTENIQRQITALQEKLDKLLSNG